MDSSLSFKRMELIEVKILIWSQKGKLYIIYENVMWILGILRFKSIHKRLLHDIFHIGPGISPRLPYINPESEAHILHWLFLSIDFYIAEKIFELTNCENKSLRELHLFNLQIFSFRVWFQKKYQTMSICRMTLESVGKIYPRRWHLNENSYSTLRIYLI
jgi:hypothetical protein